MENFALLLGDQSLSSSREQINNALLSLRSLSAGTTFPVSNIFSGMLCYRTDIGKLYQCSNADTNEWTDKINLSICGNADTATTAISANRLNTNAGSKNKPVYFLNGVPVTCDNIYSLYGETIDRDSESPTYGLK